jgi:hypothetical protein
MGHRTGWAGAFAAALLLALATRAPAAEPPAKAAAAPGTLRILAKARQMSTYNLGTRFEVGTRDITFEAPAAYQSSFDFWASRMKGQKRSEVCDITTITQGVEESGDVPFRRTIPRFDIEVLQGGQIYAPGLNIGKALAAFAWEGSLDRYGNVKEMRRVEGTESDEIKALAIPEMSHIFPEIAESHDLKVGEGFKDERIVRLPTKLTIAGLEHVTIKWTREYILKSQDAGIATFEVKTTYATDPAFKPEMERTTCQVSGSGTGEATFEVKRGVFLSSRLPSTMHIEIEAPLRPLPEHPETEVSGTGKSHVLLDLLLTGEQTVKRVWGDDTD